MSDPPPDARSAADHHQDAQDALVEDRSMRPANAVTVVHSVDIRCSLCGATFPDYVDHHCEYAVIQAENARLRKALNSIDALPLNGAFISDALAIVRAARPGRHR